MADGDSSIKVVLSAVFGNLVITIAKFAGWILSGSPSMLAEGIHSLADTFNQGLLFVGIKHGQVGPSRNHPFGLGQSRYLWNLVSAIGIFFVGFGVTAYHGFLSLFESEEFYVSKWQGLSIGILIFSFFIESIPFYLAVKAVNAERGERGLLEQILTSDNPTNLGVLFEDAIALLGVIVALVGIGMSQYFESFIPDAIASIVIAILLGVMAVVLAFINGRLLIGRAVTVGKEQDILEFVRNFPSVERVAKVRTEIRGPKRMGLTMEVEFHGSFLIDRYQIEKDAEAIRKGEDPIPILVDTAERMVRVVGREINRLEEAIQKKFPEITYIELEVN